MKRCIFVLLMCIFTCSLGFSASETPVMNLPAQANEFIQKHFPGYKIIRISMEREFTGKEYKAYINKKGNAYKLEFDAKGQIKDMDAQGKKALPNSSIPAMIVDYVKENFTGSKIMEWSQSRKLQVVELDNDMELVFDRHGNLVKIDD